MFEGPYAGFKSVIDFRSARAPLPALGFYAFHVVGCVAASSILSGAFGIALALYGMDYHQPIFLNLTIRAAEFVSEAYATLLYALIIHARGAWSKPASWLGLVLAFALSLFGGALLGIVPSAVTLGLKSKNNPVQ